MKKIDGTIAKELFGLVAVLVVSILIEIFVCNFRSFQSLDYDPVPWTDCDVMVSGGHYQDETGWYKQDDEKMVFELSGINREVKNVKLDIEVVNSLVSPEIENGVAEVSIELDNETRTTDESLISGKIKKVLHVIPDSQYYWIDSNGISSVLRVALDTPSGYLYDVHEIMINSRKTVHIDLVRVLLIFIVIASAWILRPNAYLWSVKAVDDKSWKKTIAFICYTAIFVLGFLWIRSNPLIELDSFSPYKSLAHSLYERSDDSGENAGYVLRNYGILPCVVLYLPFLAISGLDMPDSIAVLITAMITIISLRRFLRTIIRIYYPNTSYADYILMIITTVVGTGMVLCVSQPNAYLVPVLMAVALTENGIAFWVDALNSCEIGKNKVLKLTLGSVMMSLVYICRPVMLVFSLGLPAIIMASCKPVIIKEIRIKQKIIFAANVLIPYIICIACAAYFDRVRFSGVRTAGVFGDKTAIPATELLTFATRMLKYCPVLISFALIILLFCFVKKRKTMYVINSFAVLIVIEMVLNMLCNKNVTAGYGVELLTGVFIITWAVLKELMVVIDGKVVRSGVVIKMFIVLMCLYTVFVYAIFQLFQTGEPFKSMVLGNTELFYRYFYLFNFWK